MLQSVFLQCVITITNGAAWSIEFQTNGGYFDTRKKSLETRSEDTSDNEFREILKCFRKTAKFEFFTKQIIYFESPDHPLQNDI